MGVRASRRICHSPGSRRGAVAALERQHTHTLTQNILTYVHTLTHTSHITLDRVVWGLCAGCVLWARPKVGGRNVVFPCQYNRGRMRWKSAVASYSPANTSPKAIDLFIMYRDMCTMQYVPYVCVCGRVRRSLRS